MVHGIKRKKTIKIRFNDLTKDNIGQFRRLNLAVFPVTYSDKFYKDILSHKLVWLVYHSDVLVGAVACRVESKKKPATENENSEKKDDAQKDKTNSSTNTKPMKRVYVMTLGVLPVYRRYGIGRRMLEKVIDAVEKSEDLDEIYLNMQVNNEEALGFYKNFGFDVVQRIPGYYKRIEPSDCFEVARFFNKNKDSAKAGGKAAAADVEAKGDATKAASK